MHSIFWKLNRVKRCTGMNQVSFISSKINPEFGEAVALNGNFPAG